jgi:hypothetical protein
MAMKFAYWLLVIAGAAAGVYVDEPLLYDTFPPDFIWAAATSAHQIEGGWDADGSRLMTCPLVSTLFFKSNSFENVNFQVRG